MYLRMHLLAFVQTITRHVALGSGLKERENIRRLVAETLFIRATASYADSLGQNAADLAGGGVLPGSHDDH
jgi:hypothetical protein